MGTMVSKKMKKQIADAAFLQLGLLIVAVFLLLTFFGPIDGDGKFGLLSTRQQEKQSFALEVQKPKNEKIVFEDDLIAIEKVGNSFLVTIKSQDVEAARVKAQNWFVENKKTSNLCDLKISFVLGKGIEVAFSPEKSVPDGCSTPQRPIPPANVDLNRQPKPVR